MPRPLGSRVPFVLPAGGGPQSLELDTRLLVDPRRGNWQLMADINRNLVVNVLRTCPVMSRADLSRATGLSGPTVSSIVADLTSRGLVEGLGQGISAVGDHHSWSASTTRPTTSSASSSWATPYPW